jgi:hypothetical protein
MECGSSSLIPFSRRPSADLSICRPPAAPQLRRPRRARHNAAPVVMAPKWNRSTSSQRHLVILVLKHLLPNRGAPWPAPVPLFIQVSEINLLCFLQSHAPPPPFQQFLHRTDSVLGVAAQIQGNPTGSRLQLQARKLCHLQSEVCVPQGISPPDL